MSSINPYSGYGTSASRGMSGLVSGLDTQSMVEKMLSGTQAKIDRQNALKQQTIWKQEAYRKAITSIRGFKDMFFSMNRPETAIMSSSFYNTMTAATLSKAVRVTADGTATSGKVTINEIKQLASARKEESSSEVTADLAGNINIDALKKTVKISVGNNTQEIALRGDNNADILTNLNADLAGLDATATVTDGKLTIAANTVTDPPTKVSVVGGSTLGLSMLGMSAGTKGDGSIEGKLDATKAKVNVTVNLDGISKTIELDTSKLETNDTAGFAADLQKTLNKTFGNGIKVGESNGKLTFTPTKADGITVDNSRQIMFSGDSVGLDLLGVKNQQSNKMNLNMTLNDLNFAKDLQGSAFSFTINGVKIEASGDESMRTVMNRINASDAGVTVSYSSLTDKFSIESKVSGANTQISMSQETGNLLSVMFGTTGSRGVGGNKLTDGSNLVASGTILDTTNFNGGDVQLKVGGETLTFNVPERFDGVDADGKPIPKPYTKEEVIDQFNAAMRNDSKFDGIEFRLDKTTDADGNDVFHAAITNKSGKDVTFVNSYGTATIGFGEGQTTAGIVAKSTSTLDDVGLSGSINLKAEDVNGTINNINISLDGNKTIEDLLTEINTSLANTGGTAAFDEATGKIVIAGVDPAVKYSITGNNADGTASVDKMFGSSEVILEQPGADNGTVMVEQGQNAILTVNGQEIERNSNTVVVDGVTVELVTTTKPGDDPIEIGVTRNTDQVVTGLKGFVEEYNKMIDTLNGLIGEEPTYKEYPPLTAAQKKEMSESEIKVWEEKAKQGLIRRDDTINQILMDMRSSLFQQPDGSKYSLADLGITTGNYADKGKLIFDSNSEAAIKRAMELDPQEVEKLFTAADKGLGTAMEKIINESVTASALNSSSGSLINLAGVMGTDSGSTLGKKIKEYDDTLEKLKKTYEVEKTRYWKQFNAMEQVVNSMNQQSTWLASQMGG